jgi:hypothetical protein
MISQPFHCYLKTCRRCNIANDSNHFACFIQNLALLDVHLEKAMEAAFIPDCLAISVRIVAAFAQAILKERSPFFVAVENFLGSPTPAIILLPMVAKPKRVDSSPENNEFQRPVELLVLQHVHNFKSAHDSKNPVISSALGHGVKMRTHCNRGPIRMPAFTP